MVKLATLLDPVPDKLVVFRKGETIAQFRRDGALKEPFHPRGNFRTLDNNGHFGIQFDRARIKVKRPYDSVFIIYQINF